MTCAFYNPSVFREQFFTAKYLRDNGEYNIRRLVCSMRVTDDTEKNRSLRKLFSNVTYYCDPMLRSDMASFLHQESFYNVFFTRSFTRAALPWSSAL